jgi:hypothetical protein
MIPDIQLAKLNAAIAGLQRSTRRTVPMFGLGILATLVAAAIALYSIITLSGDLREAKRALRLSDAALASARFSLNAANSSLYQAQTVATAPASAGRIRAAISYVSRSQKDLTIASSSLSQAAARLPASTDKGSDLTGSWTDEYGTVYEISYAPPNFTYRATFRNAAALGPRGLGTAHGNVRGNALTYVYDDAIGEHYNCQAKVSADYQHIDEACRKSDGGVLRVTMSRS